MLTCMLTCDRLLSLLSPLLFSTPSSSVSILHIHRFALRRRNMPQPLTLVSHHTFALRSVAFAPQSPSRVFSPVSHSATSLASKAPVERGVSIDQDGKSNVWAIEPKMEVDNKSTKDKSIDTLKGLGGVVGLGLVAMTILTNLPDMDMY